MPNSKAQGPKQPRSSSSRAKSAEARSERRFQNLIKQSNDVIQLVSPEGHVLYSSDSLEKVLGYKPKDVIGVDVRPYIHPDDWGMFILNWQELLKSDKSQITIEYRVKRHTGEWVWVETTLTNHLKTAGIKAVLGNFRDISERKRAEEHLRESEQQLRFMAESMPQKVFTTQPDGSTSYLNPQWQEFSGMTLSKLLRGGWHELIHPDDHDTSIERWSFSLETGEPFSVEQRMRRYDGEYRWHITRVKAMRDEHGTVIKWFGSSTDIHDSKIALQREHALSIRALKLTKQREELIALNASKDEFISLASHQLRTPATIVKQYLHILLEGYVGELPQDIEEMVGRANISNERQIEIVDDLLRVARIDAGKIELVKSTVPIVPLVQEVVNEHHTILSERGQKASVSYNQSGIKTQVDRPRMKMVLENILDNASKYSPYGKKIQLHIAQNKESIEIEVQDQGVGIAQEDIPKLFQKFSRIPNSLSVSVGGTGLGLYWAKRIVDLHGGSIAVNGEPDKGSTFTITLPVS